VIVRVGTRSSRLALIQAGLVADLLREAGQAVEIVELNSGMFLLRHGLDLSPRQGVFERTGTADFPPA